MIDERSTIDLIVTMHEAALDPGMWPAILTRVGAMLRGSELALAIIGLKTGMEFHATVVADPNRDRLMRERYATPASNPGLKFMFEARPMIIAARESIQSDQDMLRSDYYNDIMRPHDLWHAATGAMHRDRSHVIPFGAMRRRSAGPYDETELQFLRVLVPHLHRSMRVFQRLREMEARVSMAGVILDCSNCGVVATDPCGRIGTANHQAEVMLAEADGLLLREGVLVAARHNEADRLARLILHAAGGTSGTLPQAGGTMQISRPSRRRSLPLVVTPLRSPMAAPYHPFSVSVVFSDPERVPEANSEMLARVYGLTPREAAVANLLLRGHGIGAAAEALAMKMSTMRTHIQHLYQKTDTSRLPELLHLLLRHPAGW